MNTYKYLTDSTSRWLVGSSSRSTLLFGVEPDIYIYILRPTTSTSSRCGLRSPSGLRYRPPPVSDIGASGGPLSINQYMYVCIYLFIYYINTYLYIFLYINICLILCLLSMSMCFSFSVYIYIHIHTHVYIYIHIYIYIYIYICIHVYV